MRFLGIGDVCDLAALYLRLIAEGHEVRIFISNTHCHGTLAGMVERTSDWTVDLDWIRAAGDDGIILFENVAYDRGHVQDDLRRQGFRVIGGSAYGDRLENDRAFGMALLGEQGMKTAGVREFARRDDGLAFIDANPARYVLKFNGPVAAVDNYVGRLKDGRDVRAFLANLSPADAGASFILMEHIDGIEMGVGAYFNGERFITPACLDWEHKRLFPGDLGELTGEMGTVVTYDRTQRFFEQTLLRIEPALRAHRHCGYVNINTIVNAQGIWPLEFTCRFGYPGYAILDPLQKTGWGDLFRAMVSGADLRFETRPGFCVGVVLTTPPFPYSRPTVVEPVGLPVLFDGELSRDDRSHLHFGEMGMQNGQLVTSGIYGWTMVVTGMGDSIEEAQRRANALADRVLVPNVRYRRDIGDKLIAGDLARVEALGLFDPR